MHQLKSCGVLVIRGEPIDSFLLMKHVDRLDLPKGHVDSGETEVECALRELEEETSITADDVELDPSFRFTHRYIIRSKRVGGEKAEKTLVVFLGRLKHEVTIVTTEHIGYQWTPWNPPHQIQQQTIDPLLSHVAEHVG